MNESMLERLKKMGRGESAPAPLPLEHEVKSSLENPKDASILIVDDEETVLKMLALDLSQYTVYQASNGPKALELYKEKSPELVIADMRMEPWDGNELSEKILQINPSQRIIVRSGQLGKYDPEEILQVSKPYRIVQKTAEGDKLLHEIVDQSLLDVHYFKLVTVGKQTGVQPNLPKTTEGQVLTPSIVGDNPDFVEGGKWTEVYPLFSEPDSPDRPVIGHVHITPRYALDAIFKWTRDHQVQWEKLLPYKRADKLAGVGRKLESIVNKALVDRKKANASKELELIEHISQSAGIGFNTTCEGLMIDANYMALSRYILEGTLGKPGAALDSAVKNIKAKGVNTVVTRATMTHTPACHDIPSVLGGNGLIRRGDLYCPAITHLFLKLMHDEGIPAQQFFSISKEDPTLATRYLYRMSDHFDFMGHIVKGLQLVHADLVQYFIDTNQKQKVEEYENLLSKGNYERLEAVAQKDRQNIQRMQKRLTKLLPAAYGVGLFVAHKGFSSVRNGANLKYAAEQNAHGAVCFPTSCKRTDIIAVDKQVLDQYIQEHISATERLMQNDQISRPHQEWLEKLEDKHMDRRIVTGAPGNSYLGEIIYGFEPGNPDRSKPPIGILYPENLDPSRPLYKDLVNLVGAEGHCQHSWIMPIGENQWNEWLNLLRDSASYTQFPMKPGGSPMFLEATTFFDPKDSASLEFHNQYAARNIAAGTTPMIRTTHVYGHLPWVLNDTPPSIIKSTIANLSQDAGSIGMHERKHFLQELTEQPLIIADYKKLATCLPAVKSLYNSGK